MTDEELMLGVCNGDQSAYQAIVKKHLQAISHYAFRILGSSKDTEDITQETFLRLWLNAAKWQSEKSNLSTWLHRIAHNLCIDHIRKQRNIDTQGNFAEELFEATVTDSVDCITEDLVAQRIHAALLELPESQRSALMLCHYQGFSNKDAAAIMDVSVEALESAIARAKRTLRKRLTGFVTEASVNTTKIIQSSRQGNDNDY